MVILVLIFKVRQSFTNKSMVVGTWMHKDKKFIFNQDYTYEDNLDYSQELSFVYEISETDSSIISIYCKNRKDCFPSRFKIKYFSKNRDTIIWYSFWTETKDDTLIRVK